VTPAIPGTGSLAHLEENMAAGSITLTAEDLSDLASRPGKTREAGRRVGRCRPFGEFPASSS